MLQKIQQRLKSLLSYCPETGNFYWADKPSKFNHIKVGEVAGTISKHHGYVVIACDKKLYRAHRLAWYFYHGEWLNKPLEIDHINGIRSDNRIGNLRVANRQQNMQNERKARVNNKSGFLGVHEINGVYRARICVDGKEVFLGQFKTPEEASSKYLEAKRKYHNFSTI